MSDETVKAKIAEFVAAADALVNMLATENTRQSQLDAGYDRYDQAREDLTGEKLGEEEDD